MCKIVRNSGNRQQQKYKATEQEHRKWERRKKTRQTQKEDHLKRCVELKIIHVLQYVFRFLSYSERAYKAKHSVLPHTHTYILSFLIPPLSVVGNTLSHSLTHPPLCDFFLSLLFRHFICANVLNKYTLHIFRMSWRKSQRMKQRLVGW